MIEKIKKDLEDIYEKKEQIKYLLKKLKATKNKELQVQIKEIINQVMSDENLEDRIQIQQPNIDVQTRKFEAPELPKTQRIQEKEEKEKLPEITYDTAIQNYHTQVQEVRDALMTKNPTERDTLTNLNISRTESVRPYMAAPERQTRQYDPQREPTPDFQFQAPLSSPSMDIIDILQRQKQHHFKPKYELK
ncbi:hypothetical protein K8R33_02720 [archaeon]|nr:hypothetical protein [archaeon]